MEQLIPIANKLQDVLGAVGVADMGPSDGTSYASNRLNLPQMVVVGGQSSGKSSVLESIVGRSFLPRGTGIVTRRPLIIQLYNTSTSSGSGATADKEHQATAASTSSKSHSTSSSSSSSKHTSGHSEHQYGSTSNKEEWGEFLHLQQDGKRNKRYYDFDLIRAEIVRETDRVTGTNKGISSQPIYLKIFSPRVLQLTLVDLPGMAKIPVGNQPADIEQQIYDLCWQYCQNPASIILAVSSANSDLATSDALQLAKAVDPQGQRTLGILTKIDLMDPGTDCVDILQNKVIALRPHGYIAVVNRGQQDIQNNTSVQQGWLKEEAFFQQQRAYSHLQQLCGTRRLAIRLNTLLMHHIRECLPTLKARIVHMIHDIQQELEALGGGPHDIVNMNSRSQRATLLLNLLSQFSNNFAKVLDGSIESGPPPVTKADGSGPPITISTFHGGEASRNMQQLPHEEELIGGARISYVFTELFASSLNSVKAFDGMTDGEIRTTIANANGTRPALFVPEISFDILVKRQISRLESPGIQCVELVHEELRRVALLSMTLPTKQQQILRRFPVLRERILQVVSAQLDRCVGPTQMMVSNLIQMERAYINTSHPDFVGGSKAVAKLMKTMGQNKNENRAERRRRRNKERTGDDASTLEEESNINKHGSAGMAASPLSSSSLSYHDDSDNENKDPGGDKNGSGSGIMGMIFRGSGNTTTNETTTSCRTESESSVTTPTRRSKTSRDNQIRGGATVPTAFIATTTAALRLPQVPDIMKQTDFPPSERERVETEIIKTLVDSYFGIVRKNFIDLVPKTIMYFMVNHVRDSLQNELVSELYRDSDNIAALLKEADDIAERRQTCMEMKDLLGKALEIVNEVRDFKVE